MRLTTNGSLTVSFEGIEKFAAFKREVVIDRSEVSAVRFHASYDDPGKAWRVAGTGFPRRVYSGHFRRHGLAELWYVRRPTGFNRWRAANLLEIETTGHYARVLLSVTPEDGERIVAWSERGA